jgi:hypothetical protein
LSPCAGASNDAIVKGEAGFGKGWTQRPVGAARSGTARPRATAKKEDLMAVTTFQDLPMADRDREWDGDAAEARVRRWAGVEDEPNEKYRDAHVWYDAENKDNLTAYKLLIADVIDDELRAVPRGVMAAGNVMQGARGGVDIPADDVERVKNHLARYYEKMDDEAPWRRD